MNLELLWLSLVPTPRIFLMCGKAITVGKEWGKLCLLLSTPPGAWRRPRPTISSSHILSFELRFSTATHYLPLDILDQIR
jgi:hypothetical protein